MNRQDILSAAKRIACTHNVSLRVLDKDTGAVVAEHTGHNSATNSLLVGIGYYLTGEGVLNQGEAMLKPYVPQYISLGTMGLAGQHQDESGLPIDIGLPADSGVDDATRYTKYVKERPGFGADGYDMQYNNDREYFGLGYPYTSYDATRTYGVDDDPIMYQGIMYRCIQETERGVFNPACWEAILDMTYSGFEIISPTFPRSKIAYRDVVPEAYSEHPTTLDVVFSAMVSTGALAQFRGDNDYVFISEAGLWSNANWVPEGTGENGLLAGYRLLPPDTANWDMTQESNRKLLQQNILRVGRNQVVQIIWKMQLGSVDEFGGIINTYDGVEWYIVENGH